MASFNWDAIEIGHLDAIDNSNYFANNHSIQDKISKDFFAMNIDEEKENDSRERNKNNCELITNDIKGNIRVQPFNFTKPNDVMKKDNSPRAYKYAQIYENKKQSLRNKVLEEEKKGRIFHSKSVPNFIALHEKHAERDMEKRPLVVPKTPLVLKKSKEIAEKRKKIIEEFRNKNQYPKFVAQNFICLEKKTLPKVTTIPVTCPKTPTVLKNSAKGQQRKKLLVEDLKRKNDPIKFTAKDANVLQMEPFVPRRGKVCTNIVPFELRMENRLIQRKMYDQKYKQSQEEYQKKEEEKRKLADDELVKELRKNTTFKARPNPFK